MNIAADYFRESLSFLRDYEDSLSRSKTRKRFQQEDPHGRTAFWCGEHKSFLVYAINQASADAQYNKIMKKKLASFSN